MPAGGPRPARVRIWLRRAAARDAAGECGSASNPGSPIFAATTACNGELATADSSGNSGQCEGARRLVCVLATASASADIPQWCAPWRRQQAGRRDSALAGSTAANGSTQYNRTSNKLSARLISSHPISETSRDGFPSPAEPPPTGLGLRLWCQSNPTPVRYHR
jgi:hypothetical protein